jgi:succinoglycan biosynthesis protein ExoO
LPTVSVILPTFRSGLFVARAINSVLAQEQHVHELIVVDDCSGDDSLATLRAHHGESARVRLLSTDRNGGPGAARNVGLRAATGEWIALIDADDAWAPDRLARLLSLCTNDADVVFDNITLYDHAAKRVTGPMFASMPQHIDVVAMAGERVPGSRYNYGYLKPMIRKSLLDSRSIAYQDVRVSEDLLFFLDLLLERPRVRISNDAGYIYTAPVGPTSGQRSTLSTSVSDDLLLAGMLKDWTVRNRDRLVDREAAALNSRIQGLVESAPLTMLYDSWSRGQYLKFGRSLLTNAGARAALARKLRRNWP